MVGDATGVVCQWPAPTQVDVDRYVLFRSLNEGDTMTIAMRRADQQRMVIDREVQPGDLAIYLVRGMQGDRVVAASTRVSVRMPAG